MHWLVLGTLGITGLYGLHRLALRLEERGHIYYLRKAPRGGGSRALVALQEVIEPSARHVIEVRDERRSIRRNDRPRGDGPEGSERSEPLV